MRMSMVFCPTLREAPAEAEIPSHRLMLRAGLMRKVSSGVYTLLPLGARVLRKVMTIVREEMDRVGSQELLLPILQPAELWYQTGRWEDYGEEMFKLKDRHDRQFCLGPTHEEIITTLVSSEVRSHRQLPLLLYQIQNKYRDEIRPRFGVMRGREFIMKDLYSFDRDEEGLEESYRKMYRAYTRVFARSGLATKPVLADPGAIGGTTTHEFMVLAESGEAAILHCSACGYAANVERAECAEAQTAEGVGSHEDEADDARPGHSPLVREGGNGTGEGEAGDTVPAGPSGPGSPGVGTAGRTYAGEEEVDNGSSIGVDGPDEPPDGCTLAPLAPVSTPAVKTVEQLSAFLACPKQRILKTLFYLADGRMIAALVRGDDELNEIKLARAIGVSKVVLADDRAVEQKTGFPIGFVGPVGLRDVTLVADRRVAQPANLVAGANRPDTHLLNVNAGRDYRPDIVADVRVVRSGDLCPECRSSLAEARGIEVGQVFKLGTKYSKVLGATYLDQDGKEQLIVMGCYGIGVTRTMAAVIEQHYDENGIRWPMSVAPFQVVIVPANSRDDAQAGVARELYDQLNRAGIEVILDDRDERAGVKFKDADLIGFPVRVTVGSKVKEHGLVDVRLRRTGEETAVRRDDVVEHVVSLVHEELAALERAAEEEA
ncbi:MAG: proline--tRNA ligase [Firmicutes bacterium]|nr:proline--tRNA ligase [Bacillota bacterium]